MRMRFVRYLTFVLCVATLAAGMAFWTRGPWAWRLAGVGGALSLLGIRDLIQRGHSIQRNYPVIGHIRWIAELVRPEIRQYLIEADEDAAPFSRSQRSLVYQRAKGEAGEHPFGTLLDVYRDGYEFIAHSMRPALATDPASFRITIGNSQCAQPYSASVFNISAMSFGALSANAIRVLNIGAKAGGFYHDTGEGSISPYHREGGGDIVWEVASGYFGCRTDDGHFDPGKFAAQARTDQVRMIEIKLSQGAKPGHGGVLPAAKVTHEIAETRGVPMGQDCISPSRHSAFSTPREMMGFITQLRELSGGKPVGFKLCIGHPWEFMGIVKAMLETGVRPDFIVVDGGEGGTGAAPTEFSDHIGAPMREGLLFVHNTLVGAGVRRDIKVGAAGKVVSAFDIASLLAIGADWTNAARGFMFALGCVQSLSCNTNRCPTGVATQDPLRQKALVAPDKSVRVANFHRQTLRALADMLAAAGLEHPDQLDARHLVRRVSATEIRQFADLHLFLKPDELVTGACEDGFYRQHWTRASADSFDGTSATGGSV
ncbi:FMN-binding glutamate synthase family protein [Phenylobacterium sp.]|uniref:FMN-binding glutamate synthase family protein n=1 Tax=Phenylobacterium sp. TaxID=1871053 RepID=UPI0012092D14|nr:FMN-binding glutamate synthase family protein [Phenylobacterium sp.]THD63847.1 MAG: FMN-binding glutamate synthase family protein [Phenylobacterium sp.]